MKLLNKDFAKYSRPMFFNFGRILIYIIGIILLLGVYSQMNKSDFIFINFFIVLFITICFVVFDIMNGIRKIRTYLTHKVQFLEDYVLFVDHRGSFKLPYELMDSYQLIANQIVIRIKGLRFIISGKHHGINFEEIVMMKDFLASNEVEQKTGRGFVYFILAFLFINYGLDYIFIQVLQLSSDVSLFGTLYFCLIAGIIYYIFEKTVLRKLLFKET